NTTRTAKTQRPQTVNTENVIGAGVGVKHRIKLVDAFASRVLTEIGSGVDENKFSAVLDQNRGPSATIMRTGGAAHGATAADGRHAHGGAAAQHGQRSRHRARVPVQAPRACGGRASALVSSR